MFRIILLGLLVTSFLGAEQKDFFMVTIPKSGTHLSTKLLNMLTNKQPNSVCNEEHFEMSQKDFEVQLNNCKIHNHFVFNHSNPDVFNTHFHRFADKHPEYVRLLQVRDLRDVLVSYVYYKNDAIIQEMGGDFSFEEKLTHILSLEGSELANYMKVCIECGIKWLRSRKVYLLRFEELIGRKGGGSDSLQRTAITKLANTLGLDLSKEQLKMITENLFGNVQGPNYSVTFREGKIGAWQEHFKPEHMALFKKKWGHYQKALGYPIESPLKFKKSTH